MLIMYLASLEIDPSIQFLIECANVYHMLKAFDRNYSCIY